MSYQTAILGIQIKSVDQKIVPELQSILKKNTYSKKIRTDVNEIQTFQYPKKHTVNFKPKLSQTYIVENWKKYNVLDEMYMGRVEERRNKCFTNCIQF